jgi:hypothetical protein
MFYKNKHYTLIKLQKIINLLGELKMLTNNFRTKNLLKKISILLLALICTVCLYVLVCFHISKTPNTSSQKTTDLYFACFSNANYTPSAKRLYEHIRPHKKLFKKIYFLDSSAAEFIFQKDLNSFYKNYVEYIHKSNSWCYSIATILYALNEMKDGDILIYADSEHDIYKTFPEDIKTLLKFTRENKYDIIANTFIRNEGSWTRPEINKLLKTKKEDLEKKHVDLCLQMIVKNEGTMKHYKKILETFKKDELFKTPKNPGCYCENEFSNSDEKALFSILTNRNQFNLNIYNYDNKLNLTFFQEEKINNSGAEKFNAIIEN